MASKNLLSNLVIKFFQLFFSLPASNETNFKIPKKILVIRQHNQLGDLLAGISLFTALKEKYPDSRITVIVSPENHAALVKNKLIDRIIVYDKSKIFIPSVLISFWKILREEYDLCIVPVVVSISFTSNLLARISNSKIRIGPNSLDGKKNASHFFFNLKVDLDWRKHPDSNVADRILDLVRPFNIDTKNFKSEINYDDEDVRFAENFLRKIKIEDSELLIGIHVGAGKPQNRWPVQNYVDLINLINKNYRSKIYLTCTNADKTEIDYVTKKINAKFEILANKKLSELAAVISLSNIFITNDTGIMHVAGTTETPQISIFGPTNPFNWAPIGQNKFFLRKSDLINDINVDDVYNLFNIVIEKNPKANKIVRS
jgi:heptosyltransferase-2